jgi:hypothetical protein
MSRSKYNAKRTDVDGIIFDSMAEARRYSNLKLLVRAGQITGLELQPQFPIVVNGKKICVYKADFRYFDTILQETIIEDVKGMQTAVYRIKKKLTEALYGIKITEIAQ